MLVLCGNICRVCTSYRHSGANRCRVHHNIMLVLCDNFCRVECCNWPNFLEMIALEDIRGLFTSECWDGGCIYQNWNRGIKWYNLWWGLYQNWNRGIKGYHLGWWLYQNWNRGIKRYHLRWWLYQSRNRVLKIKGYHLGWWLYQN